MKDVIYNFKTIHREGFLQSEIDELLANYPSIDIDKFNEYLFGATCIKKGDEPVFYRFDIYRAFLCGKEGRIINFPIGIKV